VFFKLQLVMLIEVYWLLSTSVQNPAYRDRERSPSPACKHRRVGVQSEVVNSIFMLERRDSHVMEKLLLWLVFLLLSSS
jgi:hypothetical protein